MIKVYVESTHLHWPSLCAFLAADSVATMKTTLCKCCVLTITSWPKSVKNQNNAYSKRALGLELIPVKGSQPAGDIVIHPVVGCHYFPPGQQLPSQPESITALWLVPNYTAWWQRHVCERPTY